MTSAIQQIPLRTIDGAAATLGDFQGDVLLVVNVASKCGLTPQYAALEAVHERFRDQGEGAYVHFTSTSGLIGNIGQSNYAAAKLGVVGLSRVVAMEGAAKGVRSNCIAPFAWTRMIASIPVKDEAQAQRVAAAAPQWNHQQRKRACGAGWLVHGVSDSRCAKNSLMKRSMSWSGSRSMPPAPWRPPPAG